MQVLEKAAEPDEKVKNAALMAIAKAQAELTINQAIQGGIQISKLKREDGNSLLKAISGLIYFVCESLNVGKKMSNLQIYSTACSLVKMYWRLKLEEFIFIFRQGTTGFYGKSYDRVDVEVLSGWIEQYLRSEERISYLERAESDRIAQQEADLNTFHQNNPELVASVVDSFKPERKVQKPTPESTLEHYLEQLKKNLATMKDKEIQELLKDAKEKHFEQAIKVIEDFIDLKSIANKMNIQ